VCLLIVVAADLRQRAKCLCFSTLASTNPYFLMEMSETTDVKFANFEPGYSAPTGRGSHHDSLLAETWFVSCAHSWTG